MKARLLRMSNKKIISIQVTEDHIKKGKRQSSHSCPIAIALKEQQKEFISTSVGVRYFDLSTKTHSYYGRMSKRAAQFVISFDNGLKVLPRRFRLAVISIKEVK